jgi:hypothetical protein
MMTTAGPILTLSDSLRRCSENTLPHEPFIHRLVLRTPDIRMLYAVVRYVTRVVQPNALHIDSLDPISVTLL